MLGEVAEEVRVVDMRKGSVGVVYVQKRVRRVVDVQQRTYGRVEVMDV